MEVSSLTAVPLFLISVIFLLFSWIFLGKDKRLPPGPRGLPVVGNMFFFKRLNKEKKHVHLALMEERKKYGDVIYFKVGGQGILYLNGYEAIQKAFVKQAEETSNRPWWLKSLQDGIKEGKGVIWQSGEDWKTTRRHVLQALRDFGVGKTSLEEKIFVEIEAATDCLRRMEGKPMEIRQLVTKMIVNVMHAIVFNKRYEYNDGTLDEIFNEMNVVFRQGGGPDFPAAKWLLKLFNKQSFKTLEEKTRTLSWIRNHIYKQIEEHKESFDPDNIRDFVDLYLQAKETDSDKIVYNAGNMFRVIIDLFVAGSDTTANTMTWCILFMQEHPDIQKKCKQVMQEVCGDRAVTWADRSCLPYIEAVLQEVQRLANITPFSIEHSTEEDVTMFGYNIPRRTLIRANLYSSNMDERHWDQPKLFNPERFLQNGKLKKNPAFMPFSVGPRVCAGEALAKMEMFLIFSNLLQRFTFEKGDNAKHTFEPAFGQLILTPVPYKTRAIPC